MLRSFGRTIAIIPTTIVALLYVNAAIMKVWDNGSGIWIRILGLIPDMGWESN